MGPLTGVQIVEMAGIGPAPFATMLLVDMGASVVRVQRKDQKSLLGGQQTDVTGRGRITVAVDLKSSEGIDAVLDLVDRADALIEGFRPGVMERLGLGPDRLLERNSRLVYGRMTGFGQSGPLAHRAGHDINYISLSGALATMGRADEAPAIPLNLVGDYGGGGMFLALGIVAGLFNAKVSGQGQVVDATMVDGASTLMSVFHGLRADGIWRDERGTNVLDSGAHFYEVYETADSGFMAVGAIEQQFYAKLLEGLGVEPGEMPQWEQSRWPEFKQTLAAIFRSRTRDQWTDVFAVTDACVTPVLTLPEAAAHPYNTERAAFAELDGTPVPAPAPRFSATPSALRTSAEVTDAELHAWGLTRDEVQLS